MGYLLSLLGTDERDERLLFQKHVVNTEHHHFRDGSDFLFMSVSLFYSTIFDCKIRLFSALDCSKGTLRHHRFRVIACFGNLDRLFLVSRVLC